MLKISNLTTKIGNKTILDKINMEFAQAKNYCILGPNGSGKTSITMTIAGHPNYEIVSGDIFLENNKISDLTPDSRSKLGLFVSFQNIPEIPGVKLFEFLRIISNEKFGENMSFLQFKRKITSLGEMIGFDNELLWRDLNVGCSGGEKRKVEMLQILLLQPKYVVLDEIDSGMDISAQKSVQKTIKYMQKEFGTTFIIITHNFATISKIDISETYIIQNGKIIEKGGQELIRKIQKDGYK